MDSQLAEMVFKEELAAGTPEREAADIADSVLCSPEYRRAWEAERPERLRRQRETEEELLDEMQYSGNPNEYEV